MPTLPPSFCLSERTNPLAVARRRQSPSIFPPLPPQPPSSQRAFTTAPPILPSFLFLSPPPSFRAGICEFIETSAGFLPLPLFAGRLGYIVLSSFLGRAATAVVHSMPLLLLFPLRILCMQDQRGVVSGGRTSRRLIPSPPLRLPSRVNYAHANSASP